MKKIILLLLPALFCLTNSNAQPKVRDSLNNVLATSTQDTTKVMALIALSMNEQDNVKRFTLINKALALARKIQFEKGEAQCYSALGSYFNGISDYPKALEYYLKALKIREKLNLIQGIAASLNNIGLVYSLMQNDEAALVYYFKALEVSKQNNISNQDVLLFLRIGDIYLHQNKLDSALIYSTRSYEKANKSPYVLIGLGNVYTAMGNTELAFLYYRMSIANARKNNNMNYLGRGALPQSYLGLARLFMKTSNKDSAIYYAKQTLTMRVLSQNKVGVMDAAKLLSQLYENSDYKEAFLYYKMAMEAQDSVFSRSKTAQIQSMSFSEQEGQRGINESKLKEAEDRNQNLQFAAIAIGLITFIFLFFALSRSIIVKTKFIEFFGVLLLLAVFEFINLFIHPYLAHVTSDSPVLMLGILIAIGALLIPVHHKLEKWITKIMVEKNKKIRLEAAEKTIAELAVKQPD